MLHLQVIYQEEPGNADVHPDLDRAIKDFFEGMGFTHTGQGIDPKKNERDISFRTTDKLNLSDDDEDPLDTCEGCEKPVEHTFITDDDVRLCKECYDDIPPGKASHDCFKKDCPSCEENVCQDDPCDNRITVKEK